MEIMFIIDFCAELCHKQNKDFYSIEKKIINHPIIY